MTVGLAVGDSAELKEIVTDGVSLPVMETDDVIVSDADDDTEAVLD